MSTDGLTQAEQTWVQETRDFKHDHIAYAKQQATRPQTIGYSLVDSPVGLLARILDKFAEWSDTQDSPFETMPKDRILDNVTLYWLTRCGASSARNYYESHNSLDPELRVDVPSAITMYPYDAEKASRAWAQKRYRQIVEWRDPENGFHLPSLEVPEQFVRDLQEGLAAVLSTKRETRHRPSGSTNPSEPIRPSTSLKPWVKAPTAQKVFVRTSVKTQQSRQPPASVSQATRVVRCCAGSAGGCTRAESLEITCWIQVGPEQ